MREKLISEKNLKRLLSFVIALAMVITLMPLSNVTVHAESTKIKCPECNGDKTFKCSGCDGTGKCHFCEGDGYDDTMEESCPLCEGTGICIDCTGFGYIQCAECRGTGEVDTYTVTFDTKGHGTAPSAQTGLLNEKATKPQDPTAEGYVFDGWYTDAECTNEWDFDSDDCIVYSNITLYAKWTGSPSTTTYTVSFNANGGTGTMSDVTGVSGSYTYPSCSFTAPTGMSFFGWSTSATGSVAAASEITADTTLYAIWLPSSVHDGCANSTADFHFYSTGHTIIISGTDLLVEGRKFDNGNVTDTCIGSTSYLNSKTSFFENGYSAGWYYYTYSSGKIVACSSSTPTVSSISMNSNPTKTTYNVGDSLDLTGAKITVTKSDSSTENIDVTSAMVSGFDSTTAGTKTVTVTYEEKTTTFDVTVEEKTTTVDVTVNAGNTVKLVGAGTSGWSYVVSKDNTYTSNVSSDSSGSIPAGGFQLSNTSGASISYEPAALGIDITPNTFNSRIITTANFDAIRAALGVGDDDKITITYDAVNHKVTFAKSSGSSTYTVVKGDSMWKIANANGLTLAQLVALNPQIKNINLIYPGQLINIGTTTVTGSADTSIGNSETSGSQTTDGYIVKKGDCMIRIAQKYNMTLGELASLNPQVKNLNLIYPGQVIVVYKEN